MSWKYPWTCPLCGEEEIPEAVLAHRFAHAPQQTIDMFLIKFPHIKDGVLQRFVWQHLLTRAHRNGKCCQ